MGYGSFSASLILGLILMIGAQVNTMVMGLKPLPSDVAHTLADDYERMTQAQQAPPPAACDRCRQPCRLPMGVSAAKLYMVHYNGSRENGP